MNIGNGYVEQTVAAVYVEEGSEEDYTGDEGYCAYVYVGDEDGEPMLGQKGVTFGDYTTAMTYANRIAGNYCVDVEVV